MTPASSEAEAPARPLQQLQDQIAAAVHQIRGAFALIGWILGARLEYMWLRFNVGRWAHLGLLVYLGVLVIELIMHYRGVEMFIGGSLALQIAFVLILIVSYVDHYRGWRERIQQEFFIRASARITQLLCQARADEGSPQEVVDRLLGIFRGNFEKKGAVNVNIFLYDDAAGHLAFKQAYPADAELDREFVCPAGVGGSGTSYVEEAVVYIPWRKYGSAIVVDSHGTTDQDVAATAVSKISVLQKCLIPDKVAAFESVLSVPVLFSKKCYGVLNLDSKNPNVFGIRDFPQASFYGMVIGIYLHELEKHGRAL